MVVTMFFWVVHEVFGVFECGQCYVTFLLDPIVVLLG